MANDMTNEERDYLLLCLIEECGEVIQAATKCLRFGYDRDWPGYGINHEVLEKEAGELDAIVTALKLPRCRNTYMSNARLKIGKIEKWQQYAKDNPSE